LKYLVGRTDEIPPGSRKIVRVAGRSIGVFNVDGEFLAIRNRCPHQGAPLCEGKLWGSLSASTPGSFSYSARKEILTCIWHGWEFSLRTGQSWCDPARLRVRSYSVNVSDASGLPVSVPLAPADFVKNRMVETVNPAPSPAPGMVEGPYHVPTYATTIEDGYLYLTLEISDLLAT
jgi:nitrite reductase/ring-hydroxylating ferredoxin subunit